MSPMSSRVVAVASLAVFAAFGSGCAMPESQPARVPGQWQSVVLADGVELRVSPNAGPGARKVAEDIQSEVRSRYIGAR